MLYQTLMQLSIPLKDPDLVAMNQSHRDAALSSIIAADMEARMSAENPEMLFG